MDIFDENNSRACCCHIAYSKGIFSKSYDNFSFSIYGNIMSGRNILIKYFGKLIKETCKESLKDKPIPNLYMYYCFNNDWINKKIINMNMCGNTQKLNFCALLKFPEFDSNSNTLNIAFTNDNEEWDINTNSTYSINIYPDIEKNIIKRYGLDSAPPAVIKEKAIASKSIDNFLKSSYNSLYKFLSRILNKKVES